MRKTTDANKFSGRGGFCLFAALLLVSFLMLVMLPADAEKREILPAVPAVPAVPTEQAEAAAVEVTDEEDVTTCPVFLMRGDSGEGVSRLQRQLQLLGYGIRECSGVYTPETAAAVKAFQRDCGFLADGVCTAAVSHAASYLSGEEITARMQNEVSEALLCRMLEQAGCCAPDEENIGDAGALRNALILFQRTHGLYGSGRADYATLCALGVITDETLFDGMTDGDAAAVLYDLRCRMLSEALAHFVLAYPAADDLYTLELCASMLISRMNDARFPGNLDAVCRMFVSELPTVRQADAGARARDILLLRAAEDALSCFYETGRDGSARGALYVCTSETPLPPDAELCIRTRDFVFFR